MSVGRGVPRGALQYGSRRLCGLCRHAPWHRVDCRRQCRHCRRHHRRDLAVAVSLTPSRSGRCYDSYSCGTRSYGGRVALGRRDHAFQLAHYDHAFLNHHDHVSPGRCDHVCLGRCVRRRRLSRGRCRSSCRRAGGPRPPTPRCHHQRRMWTSMSEAGGSDCLGRRRRVTCAPRLPLTSPQSSHHAPHHPRLGPLLPPVSPRSRASPRLALDPAPALDACPSRRPTPPTGSGGRPWRRPAGDASPQRPRTPACVAAMTMSTWSAPPAR